MQWSYRWLVERSGVCLSQNGTSDDVATARIVFPPMVVLQRFNTVAFHPVIVSSMHKIYSFGLRS